MKKFLLLSFFILSLTTKAEPNKDATLELGIGAFITQLPKYIGSNQHSSYVVPLPYIYYHSDRIKVDRNQFTGKIWQNNHYYLDLSVSAGIKVSSQDNPTRQDMPDLDWVLEFGPSMKYYLLGSPQQDSYSYVEFFIRKATATDFHSISNVGWRYGPSATYQKSFFLKNILPGQFEFTARTNINFSTSRYLNYYYGVTEQYSTKNRLSYHSNGGYAGSDISMGLTYKINSWWFAGFARYYNLSASKAIESPLIEQKGNWSFGLGFAWLFYQK